MNAAFAPVPLFGAEESFGDPVAFSASVTVPAGQEASPDVVRLRNSTGQTVEIHAIRFSLRSSKPGTASPKLCGGVLGAKLALNDLPLTANYVPVYSFGRSTNFATEEQYVSDNLTDERAAWSDYTWTLDAPIEVTPESVIVPTFKHFGLITEDIDARITYLGRIVPAGAVAKRWLPYVSSWSAPTIDCAWLVDAAIPLDASQDYTNPLTALVNAGIPGDLRIRRLTGRILQQYNVEVPLSITFTEEGIFDKVALGTNALDGALFVKAALVSGFELVRDLLPFRGVFSRLDRSLDVDFILASNDSLTTTIELRKDSFSQSPDAAVVPTSIIPTIAMIGYREVAP